ncbi:G2/mitotic-specific cyclin-B-like [Thrips palmi]|uniref:G2/mitotic-specific cyclin-B-like n=1 Tax=Thrips palmi TaxID=161013 RepID=A0A6P8ZBW9_THRPL|nr:G2/mitotic-specific cyclin-B-like [Thrips palmi]
MKLHAHDDLFGSEDAAVQPKDFIEDDDKADENNPLFVADYVFEFYEYLYSLEEKYPIKKGFLREQFISPGMRAVLVDWLVGDQLEFGLLQETLYLAVQILDRYLQAKPIHHCFSKFFLELAMMAYSLCHVRPSLIAAAALYISLW